MSIVTRNSKTLRDECRICGVPADYSYYGAMSCQSCKVFFKRHAEQNEVSSSFIYNQITFDFLWYAIPMDNVKLM
jgi:hypothetical protein